MSDNEQSRLADVTDGAIMSPYDDHGNLLAVVEKAAANKVEIELPIGK